MALITQDKAKAYDPKMTEQRADVLKNMFAVPNAPFLTLSPVSIFGIKAADIIVTKEAKDSNG